MRGNLNVSSPARSYVFDRGRWKEHNADKGLRERFDVQPFQAGESVSGIQVHSCVCALSHSQTPVCVALLFGNNLGLSILLIDTSACGKLKQGKKIINWPYSMSCV